MHGGAEIIRYCAQCGQQLVFPTADLRRRFRCPRCFADYVAGDIIGTDTPLAAVPASERQGPGVTAPMPVLIVGSAGPRDFAAAGLEPSRAPEHRGHPWVAAGVPAKRVDLIQQATLDVEAAFIWLLDIAQALDQKAERRRLLLIFAAAAAATVFAWLDETFDYFHALSIAATIAFPMIVLVFAFARLNAFRREDGTWQLKRGFSRFGEAMSDLWQEALALSVLKERVGWLGIAGSVPLILGVPMSATGLVLKLLQSLFSVPVFKDAIGYCDWGGFLAFVGALLLGLGVHGARKKAQQQDLLVASPAQQQRLVSAASMLPVVLDANEAGSLRAAAEHVDHRLVREILLILEAWRPNNFQKEEKYEKALFGELLKTLGASRPERQFRIGGKGRGDWGKADIAVGESILIEMKHRWKEPDRTIAQVERYAGYWKDRGLVVLLLCGLEGEDAQVARKRLTEKFTNLRPAYPCIAIFAARRT